MTTKRTRRAGLALALAFATASALLAQGSASALPPGAPAIGMVCTPGAVGGGTHTFNLVANTGYMATPDGNSIFMWSYANADAPDNGAFQTPGPVLCVTQGEHVVVNLQNTLPDASSVVFPGQTGVKATGGSDGLLTKEALANGNVSYDFTAGNPGTYLYESGSDVSKQVEMGLYGALIVRPTIGANYAYDSTTQFNPGREFLMLLAEIDPDLHHAVDVGMPYDFTALHNHYYTINGRSFPDTIQDNGSALLPSQPYGAMVRIQPNTVDSVEPALIRMIDAGVQNHPFHPHGNHTTQIAQDGRLLSAPTEHFGETIGAGETEDFLLRWDDPDHWNPTTNPLPVAQPNYRNLTFKDARTWYAGSPYLGYKGTLPTGTTSLNLCGEWYFPLHSHALNEFSNFNEGFGGMGTLLRVDPPGGCFTAPSSTKILVGKLKTGVFSALGVDDTSYYQVNPKTTTAAGATTTGAGTISVASAASFPAIGSYYIQVDGEVMLVTGGQGTTTWTVSRGQLGTVAAAHSNGATVTGLSNDWYATFSGVATGSQNLKVTYKGKNCGSTAGATCPSIPMTTQPQQTVKICDWTISGPSGCATPTSNGWVTFPALPAQPQSVGAADVSSTSTSLPQPAAHYIGTGSHDGEVRVLVHTETAAAPVSSTTLSAAAQVTTITGGTQSGTAATTTIHPASKIGFPAFPFYIQVGSEVEQVTGNASVTTWNVLRGQLGTTRATHANNSQILQASIGVGSAATFPSTGSYYVRVNNEIMLVTGGQGTTSWVVSRAQLGTAGVTQASGSTIRGVPTFSTWGNLMKLVYDAP